MKLSPEIINQIPVLYAELNNKAEVARRLGISQASVSKYLKLFEAEGLSNNLESVEKPKARKLTDDEIKLANELYAKYVNMAKVARELNTTAPAIKKILTEENLGLKDRQKDDLDALFFYIYRLFGQFSEENPVNPWNIIQFQKFKTEGISYRAQLLTLKYFYEVKKNSVEKSHGSIGIIPYVVSDAQYYYESQAARANEILNSIQRQLEKDRIEIPYNPSNYIGKKKRKQKPIDLETIGE